MKDDRKMVNIRVPANFVIIIGAQRSGTTYLYHLLDAHPQVEMAKPVRPEPKFFLNDSEFSLGKEFYLNKFFSKTPREIKVIGEKGTSYLEYDFLADRIKSFFSDARILVMLRNPVHRTLSNYFFSKKNGLETRSLKEVFIENLPPPPISSSVSVSPFNYIQRSNYSKYLRSYMDIFGDKLKILIFEEMIGNVNAVKDIYNFINVDASFVPENIRNKINSGEVNYSEEVSKEIIDKLTVVCASSIKNTESLLNKTIKSWHDPI